MTWFLISHLSLLPVFVLTDINIWVLKSTTPIIAQRIAKKACGSSARVMRIHIAVSRGLV